MSGGVALLDFDNDGLLDIYLTDALTVDTAKNPRAARSALYRNLGNGKFEDVTEKAGVGHPGWAMGVCTADVDGDGWEDIYVTGLGRNYLYRNNHDGTFTDIAEKAGVAGGGWSAGCGFADYDRDGNLDLFVSRYVKVDLDNLPAFGSGKTCQYRGIAVQCGPRGLPGESDLLFHNDGNGHFTEVSEKAGVSDPRHYFGLGVAWFDYNGDGWPDLYVANDSGPSFLYENQKDGTFKEVAFPMGVAVSEDGGEQGGMGVAVGDYDNSGRFSLYKTNFVEEYNSLFHNEGDHFADVSFRSKTAPSSLPYVKWGTAFFDYDNDGFLDIISVNGHVYPQIGLARLGPSAGYRQRKRRLDVVINDLDGNAQVLHNELADVGNWLRVKLKGKGRNTDAIGAVITVKAGKLRLTRLVQSGTSYLSQDDMRSHFGLAREPQADSIEVRWPDGTVTRRERVKANQQVEIEQPR